MNGKSVKEVSRKKSKNEIASEPLNFQGDKWIHTFTQTHRRTTTHQRNNNLSQRRRKAVK